MINVIIPLGALLIAILSVAALWLWWSDSPPETASESSGSLTFADRMPASMPASRLEPMSAPEPMSEISSMPAQSFQAAASPDEVMRVVRGNDGQLHVVMNGVTYRNMAEVSSNASVHQHFMNTLRTLSQFAQDTDGVSVAPMPAPQPAATYTAPAAVALGKDEIVEADPESVAAQIERFLQDRLARTPGMMSRSIHIYSSANGGVQIKVDSTLYESVGDVMEPDAREIIEASIRDWEASLSV